MTISVCLWNRWYYSEILTNLSNFLKLLPRVWTIRKSMKRTLILQKDGWRMSQSILNCTKGSRLWRVNFLCHHIWLKYKQIKITLTIRETAKMRIKYFTSTRRLKRFQSRRTSKKTFMSTISSSDKIRLKKASKSWRTCFCRASLPSGSRSFYLYRGSTFCFCIWSLGTWVAKWWCQ